MTVIAYDVPSGGGSVTIRIYDVGGRLIRTLIDRHETAGRKSVAWHGLDDRGGRVATGVYFYRMKAPGFEKTRKMVLLK
jgi:flagellar hook assembly protein FlgD